jgi:hypothetical protein
MIEVNKNTHATLQKLAKVISTISPNLKAVDYLLTQRTNNEDAVNEFLEDKLCIQHKLR